jgi:hypothetical protein
MNYSSIAQFGLLIVAFAIFFTYTQPTIGKIKALQDETFAYTDAITKASEFNAKLNELTNRMNSFRESDVDALEVYLPDSVDALTVMSDIETIARKNNVQIVAMTSAADAEDGASGDVQFEDEMIALPNVSVHDFNVTASGTYADLKAMLRDVERNKYLLEVVNFQFGAQTDTAAATVSSAAAAEGSYTLVLRAYAYAPETDAANGTLAE